MDQDQIVATIVAEYKNEPRNKIIINAFHLCTYATDELGEAVSPASLASAIQSYEDGDASEQEQALLDAATSLCHQVANRCWGECEDEESDEWSEVDISTEWSDYDTEDASEMFVTIYQD